MRDVIIAGGGPVGLFTAGLLEKELDVLVLEKNREVGGKACSGLISTRLEEFLPIQKEWVEHKVKGAIVHSPAGQELELKKPGTAALVIDRVKFDRALAGSLESEVLTGSGVGGIKIGEAVGVRAGTGTFSSKLLLGCDGANSFVRAHFGERPRELLAGLVALVDKPDEGEFVELWIDKEKNRDGFFWKIPRGARTEFGALGTVTFSQLENFFGLEEYSRSAGTIPLGLIKTFFPQCLLIGDAACQVKPWSGGGLVYGFSAAKIAAEVILKAFKEGDLSEQALRPYQAGWREKLGTPISVGLLARGLFKNFNNEELEELFRKYRLMDLNGMDMDFPLLSKIEF